MQGVRDKLRPACATPRLDDVALLTARKMPVGAAQGEPHTSFLLRTTGPSRADKRRRTPPRTRRSILGAKCNNSREKRRFSTCGGSGRRHRVGVTPARFRVTVLRSRRADVVFNDVGLVGQVWCLAFARTRVETACAIVGRPTSQRASPVCADRTKSDVSSDKKNLKFFDFFLATPMSSGLFEGIRRIRALTQLHVWR